MGLGQGGGGELLLPGSGVGKREAGPRSWGWRASPASVLTEVSGCSVRPVVFQGGRGGRRPHRLPWAEWDGEMALSSPWPPDADLKALRAKKGDGGEATKGYFPHHPFHLSLPCPCHMYTHTHTQASLCSLKRSLSVSLAPPPHWSYCVVTLPASVFILSWQQLTPTRPTAAPAS